MARHGSLRASLGADAILAWIRRLRQHDLAVWAARAVRGFIDDEGLLRASALTYSTLLAVVPLLAVVLALLQGAGFSDSLRPFLIERFPVLGEAAIDALLGYIGRASAQSVGGFGLVALLTSAWIMLGNVEAALNHMFGAQSSRGLLRRASEYVAMLVFGTAIVAVTISLQTVLSSPELYRYVYGASADFEAKGLIRAIPWVNACLGFTLLYAWMPNVKIPIRLALAGGVVGGTLFQLSQVIYIELQLGFGRAHAIYGALAQLPILLVWIYGSWVIVLMGAEAIAARRSLELESAAPVEADPRADLGLAVLRAVMAAFEAGLPTPRADELAARLGVSAHDVRDAAAPLIRARILAQPDEDHGYLPVRAAASLSLDAVLAAFARSRAARSAESEQAESQ